MSYFGFLLCSCLALLCLWSFHWLGKWSQLSTEQAQIDAINLSICHSQKNFLQSELRRSNAIIQGLQTKMSLQVAQCELDSHKKARKASAPFPPPANAGVYATTFSALMSKCNIRKIGPLEKLGKSIEQQQELSIFIYKMQAYYRTKQLAHQQGMRTQSTQLDVSHQKGFRRKDLKAHDRLQQFVISQFGPSRNWPQQLEPHEFFSQDYRFRHQYLESPSQASSSECQLVAKGINQFEIWRTQ